VPAAKSVGRAGAAEADSAVDGAATLIVKLPVPFAPPVGTVTTKGFGEQVTPGGSPAMGQVTFTLPLNPPVGVKVMVEVLLAPAVTVALPPPMVNEPGLVTVMVIADALEVA